MYLAAARIDLAFGSNDTASPLVALAGEGGTQKHFRPVVSVTFATVAERKIDERKLRVRQR